MSSPHLFSAIAVLTPKRIYDNRGYFSELWNQQEFSRKGIDIKFVQDNQSISMEKGTIRGLHYQAPPFAQDKLVRCGKGKIFDVAVDIRRGSPSYGSWHGEVLSADNGKQLFVPKGFLHGFMTLEPNTEVIYKCSDFYNSSSEGAIRWDDKEIGISWPLNVNPVVSEKDNLAHGFSSFVSPFTFGEY